MSWRDCLQKFSQEQLEIWDCRRFVSNPFNPFHPCIYLHRKMGRKSLRLKYETQDTMLLRPAFRSKKELRLVMG
jgi:hypothetical protein